MHRALAVLLAAAAAAAVAAVGLVGVGAWLGTSERHRGAPVVTVKRWTCSTDGLAQQIVLVGTPRD